MMDADFDDVHHTACDCSACMGGDDPTTRGIVRKIGRTITGILVWGFVLLVIGMAALIYRRHD